MSRNYRYTIKIKHISGEINESKTPQKTLIIKSKKLISENEVFDIAFEYLKKKYNLTLESAEVINEGLMDKVKGLFNKKEEKTSSNQSSQAELNPPSFPDLSAIFSNSLIETESYSKYWKDISRNLKIAGADESDIKLMKKYCTNFQIELRKFIEGSESLFNYLLSVVNKKSNWSIQKSIDWALSQYVFGSTKNSGDGKLYKNEENKLIKLAQKTIYISNKCINLAKSKKKSSKMISDSYSPSVINDFIQYGKQLMNYLEKKGSSDSLEKVEHIINMVASSIRLLMETESYIYRMENKNSNRYNQDMIRDIESWVSGDY